MGNRGKSGYLVETRDGKLGRTIHEKGTINGKIPVYLAIKVQEIELSEREGGGVLRIPETYSDTAILCDPKGLKAIGFLD